MLSEFSSPKLGGNGGIPCGVNRGPSDVGVDTCGGLLSWWPEMIGLFCDIRPPVIPGLLWPPTDGGVAATLGGGGEQDMLLLRSLVVDADESIVDSIIIFTANDKSEARILERFTRFYHNAIIISQNRPKSPRKKITKRKKKKRARTNEIATAPRSFAADRNNDGKWEKPNR